MHTSRFRLAAVLAAAALVLSACGGDDGDDGGDTGAGGGDSDTLTIGIKFDQPGLGLRDGDNYTGMDVDVARAVAEKLGYSEDKITFVETPSAQRETMLDTGQVDMIFATYSITDTRKETVQFAGPYFVAGQDLLVAADSDISGPDDLDGRILCSVAGSTSAQNVKDAVPGVQLQEYATYSECLEQLANGTIEALTTDDTILAGYAAQEQYAGQFKVVGNTFSTENYGVGLPKGDTEFCEEINGYLKELWEDGTMEQIIQDNLGPANYTPSDANPPEVGGHCG